MCMISWQKCVPKVTEATIDVWQKLAIILSLICYLCIFTILQSFKVFSCHWVSGELLKKSPFIAKSEKWIETSVFLITPHAHVRAGVM